MYQKLVPKAKSAAVQQQTDGANFIRINIR